MSLKVIKQRLSVTTLTSYTIMKSGAGFFCDPMGTRIFFGHGLQCRIPLSILWCLEGGDVSSLVISEMEVLGEILNVWLCIRLDNLPASR